MATASTFTVVDQTTDAGFRAWISGQINTSTVTRPSGASTSAGYTIWQFNDALQSTRPIYIKLEFGTGVSQSSPLMWLSTSTGTDGAGTLSATGLTTRYAIVNPNGVNSTTTQYYSRFCYNSTYGFLGMSWKIGALYSSANDNMGAMIVGRSNDASGVVTGDAVFTLTGGATNSTLAYGSVQVYSWLTSTVYPTSGTSTPIAMNGWAIWPFSPTATNNAAGNFQVTPGLIFTPNIQFTTLMGLCKMSEINLNASFSTALIGSTSLNYLNIGGPPGINTVIVTPSATYTADQLGVFMLWQ